MMETSRNIELNRENSLQYKCQSGKTIYKQQTMNKQTKNTSDLRASVIGVDLGSHSTKIAAVEKGVVDIITNEANLRQTPSVVGYGPKERLIGEAGSSKMKSNLPNTIVSPHRFLGFAQSQYTRVQGKFAACPPRNYEATLAFKVNSQGKEQWLTAEQVTAAFMTKVQSIVELNQLSNKYQVVAVPNYLTHNEKKALLDSIKISRDSQKQQFGFQVINESTAIGMDYGFYKMNEFPEKEEQAKVVLFVDFGHSKLSIYAIKFTKNYQKVIFQTHSRQIGCKNLDELMLQYYSDCFQKANPNLEISLTESRKATHKLLESIERQRKVLTGNSEYDFSIDCLLEDQDFCYSMTRTQFQQISEPVLSQIVSKLSSTKQKLASLGVEVSHIELIGGGSRIPCFMKCVFDVFGVEPSRTLNSSQCIARGAALCAAIQSGIFRVKDYYSFDQSSEAIVCTWKGEGENIQSETNQAVILNEGETIFSEKAVQLSIKPTKARMVFDIKVANQAEGINPQICSFAIQFLESTLEGEVRIKLVFGFDANRMLKQVAALQVGQKDTHLVLSNLSFEEKWTEQHIQEMIKRERQFISKDAKIIQSYEERNAFESKIYSLRDKILTANQDQATKDFVNPETLNQYVSFLNELGNNLDVISDYHQETTKVSAKVSQFFEQLQSYKTKYAKVQGELAKLEQFIEAAVAGKIKSIKFYPGEEVVKVQRWVKSMRTQLKNSPKYQELATNVEEIQKVSQDLKKKIDECQAEQLRKQKQAQKQFYYPTHRNDGLNNQSPFNYNPFESSQRRYGTRGRGRGNYSTYSPGFFNNFSTFF